MKLLTVIIPAYNVSEYIDQCISSLVENPDILEQLDIVAINDGSKDDTLEKMQKYEKEFSGCVRVIDKENGGHGSGINKGIELAQGLYLKVLDSDDWVDNKGLTTLISYLASLTEYPDAVLNPFDYVWQPDGKLEISDYPKLPERQVISFRELNEYSYIYALHSLTLKTSIYKENALPKIDEKISYDDVEYILYPVPYIHTIVYLKPVIYKYRYGIAGQSVSTSNYIKRRCNHMQVIDAMLSFFDNKKDIFSPDQIVFFNNWMKGMISHNVNILLSMKDTKQSKAEFIDFVRRCSSFDLNLVPNKKLHFLIKHNYKGYGFVSWYYRKKKRR